MILVFYRSHDPAIRAIGDVANAPDRHVLRIEFILHAQLRAQIAAADILSTTIPTYGKLYGSGLTNMLSNFKWPKSYQLPKKVHYNMSAVLFGVKIASLSGVGMKASL